MESLPLYLIVAVTTVALILNIIATHVVFRTYFTLKERRYYQTIFIWLVPFIGAMLAIYINLQEYFEKRQEKQVGNHPNISNYDAIDYALGADNRGSWDD